jgi:hypothetical protein
MKTMNSWTKMLAMLEAYSKKAVGWPSKYCCSKFASKKPSQLGNSTESTIPTQVRILVDLVSSTSSPFISFVAFFEAL